MSNKSLGKNGELHTHHKQTLPFVAWQQAQPEKTVEEVCYGVDLYTELLMVLRDLTQKAQAYADSIRDERAQADEEKAEAQADEELLPSLVGELAFEPEEKAGTGYHVV
jgi:hypothetical protein